MLRQRIITAIIALAALGVVLFVLPSLYAELIIAAVVLAGAWEWSAFLKSNSLMLRVLYLIFIAMLMTVAGMNWPDHAGIVLQVAAAWWLAAFVWTLFFPTPIPEAIRWLGGAFVLVPLHTALVMLHQVSPSLLLFALLIVWAADIGAFFFGKRFGRVRLAPDISPGKTWEGVIGGLLLVLLLSIGRGLWFETSLAVLVPFCMAVAAISIIGDLTVSMFKRTAGLKDSGTLFPGHGGVLDRVDSIAAAAPLFALGLDWTGLV